MVLETLMAGFCFMSTPQPQTPPLFTPNRQVEHPELPEKIIISDKLVRGERKLETGSFHSIPANLPVMNQAALDISVESLIVDIKKGGTAGFKALITALRLSGISIATVTGDLPAHPDREQGIRLPLWKLQMFAGQDNFTNELPLMSSLKAGSLLFKNISAEALAKSLVTDLQNMSKAEHPGVNFFAQLVNQLSSLDESPSYLVVDASKSAELEKVKITPLQLALIGLRMEAELLVRTQKSFAPNIKSKIHFSASSCVPNERETIKDAAEVKESSNFESTFKLADALKNLQRFADFLSSQPGVLGVLTAVPELNLVGGRPMVRTKTTTAGEKKILEITWHPGYKDLDQQNCLRDYPATVGLSLGNNLGNDFLKGAKAKLTIGSVNERDRLFFDALNPSTKLFTVDEKSMISTSIIGMPQPRKIPAKAKPALVFVPIKTEVEMDVMKFVSAVSDDNSDMIKAYSMLQSQASMARERTGTVTLDVKDWHGAPEGTFIAKISGDYFSSIYKADVGYRNSHATSIQYRSKSEMRFSEKSTFLPGWPDGVPLPTNIPEEDVSPHLMIQDTFEYKMLAYINNFLQEAYICDMCRPEQGYGSTSFQMIERKFSHQEKVTPYLIVSKPIKFIRSKKLAITEVQLIEVKVDSEWTSLKQTNKCPESEDDGANGGKYEDDEHKFGEFEIVIPYEVADGMAYLQGSYSKDFGFDVNYHDGQTTKMGGKLDLSIDMIVPLP